MAYPKQWIDNSKMVTVKLPKAIKPAAFALALLLDQRDPELMDFLESRFIPIPTNKTRTHHKQPIKG